MTRLIDAASPGNDQGVDAVRAAVLDAGRMHRQAAGRPDQARLGGHDLADVTAAEPGRVAEHLVRADHVERLEAVKDDEYGPALVHAFTLLCAT